MLAVLACGLAAIGGFAGLGASTQPALRTPQVTVRPQAAAIAFTFSTPTTLTFTLSDPDAAASTAAGAVYWVVTGGDSANTFNVAVSMAASSFTGCPEVPAAAATAKCSSVNGGTTGVCNASTVTLGTTPVQIASGSEATGTGLYWVGVDITLSDAWKYKGHTTACTLDLRYTITVN